MQGAPGGAAINGNGQADTFNFAPQANAAIALAGLAPTTVPLEHGLLTLVGDRAAILTQLEGLGLPAAQELDARGRPISRD